MVDNTWASGRIRSGLSTGEGLIEALQPDLEGKLENSRLFIVEPEFSKVLRWPAAKATPVTQPAVGLGLGNLATMTRNSPFEAVGAHISLVCHITAEELRRNLTETEMASGFANRFLFPWVQRSQKLPEGSEPDPDDTAAVVEKLHSILVAAKTVTGMHRSPEATEMWSEAYHAIDDDVTGLFSYLAARAGSADAAALHRLRPPRWVRHHPTATHRRCRRVWEHNLKSLARCSVTTGVTRWPTAYSAHCGSLETRG